MSRLFRNIAGRSNFASDQLAEVSGAGIRPLGRSTSNSLQKYCSTMNGRPAAVDRVAHLWPKHREPCFGGPDRRRSSFELELFDRELHVGVLARPARERAEVRLGALVAGRHERSEREYPDRERGGVRRQIELGNARDG